MKIGSTLKARRIKENLTQESLAYLCDLTRGTYSRYENDYAKPTTDTIICLCKILDITPNELLGFDGANEAL